MERQNMAYRIIIQRFIKEHVAKNIDTVSCHLSLLLSTEKQKKIEGL